MDITPAVLIFTPIFLPIVTNIGIDPVHFGIIMILNLCIGLCTPPVGSVLFVGCSVADLSIQKVIKPLMPLFIVMIIVLLLITYIPELSLWLPRQFGL
jgi:TRAP-type C4-dicarboxylate transport system permease large subunit